jgi:hypothetical protein
LKEKKQSYVSCTWKIQPDVAENVRKWCIEYDMTQQDFVNDALRYYLRVIPKFMEDK